MREREDIMTQKSYKTLQNIIFKGDVVKKFFILETRFLKETGFFGSHENFLDSAASIFRWCSFAIIKDFKSLQDFFEVLFSYFI